MTILDLVYSSSLALADLLLGWLLYLPRDLVLLLVAIGTASILTVVRVFTTNQDLLRRVAQDKQRVKAMLRAISKRDDSEATDRRTKKALAALDADGFRLPDTLLPQFKELIGKTGKHEDKKRLTATMNMITMKTLRAEGLPLLVSLIPIAFLAIWAFGRLAYYPPQEGKDIEVVAYFPVSADGKPVHIVPAKGVDAPDGWVRVIKAVTDDGPPYGQACWRLRGRRSEQPYTLEFRYEDRTVKHPLLVGQSSYSAPVVLQPDEVGVKHTETKLQMYKPLGLLPGISRIYLDPWLIGYLLIVIPFVPLLKRALRIY